MGTEPRPKRFPPPEFPPRRPALFAKTPPAIFPPILGFLGLALASRLTFAQLGWDAGPGELLAGAAVALWAFAALAYLAKVARRSGVVVEDLRVLPGRSGLAAMTMGGMAASGLVANYSSSVAAVLLVAALAGHAVLALLLIRLLLSLPPESRAVNPTLHLSFVGFIVGAPAATVLGWQGLATVIFWAVMPIAGAIWVLSAIQFLRAAPPPPLRPLLAIHLAPAALLALVGGLLGKAGLVALVLGSGSVYALVLVASVRWLTRAGVTPMWGAFTFPLAAFSAAMLATGGSWLWPGIALFIIGLGSIPAILWWVLKRWPGGKLATVTNAAEA